MGLNDLLSNFGLPSVACGVVREGEFLRTDKTSEIDDRRLALNVGSTLFSLRIGGDGDSTGTGLDAAVEEGVAVGSSRFERDFRLSEAKKRSSLPFFTPSSGVVRQVRVATTRTLSSVPAAAAKEIAAGPHLIVPWLVRETRSVLEEGEGTWSRIVSISILCASSSPNERTSFGLPSAGVVGAVEVELL